jgi:hypothetical protein
MVVNDLGSRFVSMTVTKDAPSKERVLLGRRVGRTVAMAAVLTIVVSACGGSADSDLAATTSLPENVDSTSPSSSTTSTTPLTSVTTSVVTTTTTLSLKHPAEGPVFGEETGVLLLLDDGIDGLTAVDLDRRLAGRSVVEGQRAGDEPYSMVLVGEKLVVGWHEPHAVDIASRDGLSLGHSTIFVPAAEPERVWMIDYGARIGDREPVVWQADVNTGVPLSDPVPLDSDGFPDIGIPGGLALQTDTGLDLWDMETGQTVPLEAAGPVYDIHVTELVWCSGDCSKLAVTDTSTVETEEFSPPEGFDMFLAAARISPTGRYMAALVGLEGVYQGTGLWILDRETGQTSVVSDPATHVDYIAWAPEGDQLFATSYSYSQPHTVVWRYQISDQEFTAVVLPFGGALSLVVVDDSVVDAYITDEPVEPSQCRAPGIQPSGRAEICTFGY